MRIIPVLVEAIKYDDPERSYFQLGRQLEQAGRLREALAAYERASEIRPDFRGAREAAFNVQRRLWRQDESQVIDEIKRQEMIIQQAGREPQSRFEDRGAPVALTPLGGKTFEMRYGVRLRYENGKTKVTQVQSGGYADVAGLRPGDVIVAIWNDPIQQLWPDEIGRRLNESTGELSLTVEREVVVGPGSMEIELGYEGLEVQRVAAAPLRDKMAQGDRVVRINGRVTRYLTLEQAQRMLMGGGRLLVQKGVMVREKV